MFHLRCNIPVEISRISGIMLENHCTQTVQSSCGGCSRRVHKIVYLAVKKDNIFGQFFTSENIHRELLSLINPGV